VVEQPRPPPPKRTRLKALLAEGARARAQGDAHKALEVYARALALEPKNADALASRGGCYLELSQYAPAESSFEAALEANPTHAGALMGLAETFRYEGRRPEAVGYYRKYLAAHPRGADAAAARSAIESLED
jgi:tetratricopeptide (TPR) repeat protein